MLRLALYFVFVVVILQLHGSLAEFQENGCSVCLLQDAPNQCGQFCMAALHPLFDHNRKVNAKLDRIESKLNAELLEMQKSLVDLQTNIQDKLDALQATFRENFSKINVKVIPPKFEQIGGSGRYFYIENEVKKNWTEAVTTCREMGGYLAAFKTEEELTAVQAKLRFNLKWYWIGINDRNRKGEYVSEASGKQTTIVRFDINMANGCGIISKRLTILNRCLFELNFVCQADNEI